MGNHDFVILCVFSGWIEAFPCCKDDVLTVAKKLLEHVFPTWGIASVVCDQGTHFTRKIREPQ